MGSLLWLIMITWVFRLELLTQSAQCCLESWFVIDGLSWVG